MIETLASVQLDPLLALALAIGGLIALVSWGRLNGFIALAIAAFFLAAVIGKPLGDAVHSFETGFGKTLAHVALVLALGTIIGRLMTDSGGALVIAETVIKKMGPGGLPWAIGIVAFIVGLPSFFGVGFLLLLPVVSSLAQQTGRPMMSLAIPMLAGLAASHGLTPPHPGVMAAFAEVQKNAGAIDFGKLMLYAVVLGVPLMLICGPLFGIWLGKIVPGRVPASTAAPTAVPATKPGFGLALITLVLPILLLFAASFADGQIKKTPLGVHPFYTWISFAGKPLTAMILSTLFAMVALSWRCGFSRQQMARSVEECLGPVAAVLLIVGAGGGFGQVLRDTGVADAINAQTKQWALSPLLAGWMITALLRFSVGSATAAITIASSIVVPGAVATPGINLELLILAMGCGSMFCSHLNDGGFWIVKEYLNLSVVETLKSWTLMITSMSVVGLILVLLLDALLR